MSIENQTKSNMNNNVDASSTVISSVWVIWKILTCTKRMG